MPTQNARKHVIPANGDTSVNPETIFKAFGDSIRDVVPVANTTERDQLVDALIASGQGPSGARPLYVHRLDAPGLHRTEYTVDGVTWISASGTQFFTSKAAADQFGVANGSLLSVGDKARIAGVPYEWSGTAWVGGWNAVEFDATNKWGRHVNTNYPEPGVSRINGVVWVRGTISRGVQVNGAAGERILTLPPGYRPSSIVGAVIWSNGAAGSLDIRPDGAVVVGDTPISWARADLYFSFPAGT